MALPLLEGQVDTRDSEIQKLKDRIADLQGDLEVAEAKARRAEQSAARAVGNLRNILSPLYQGLKELFGEMDTVGGEEPSAPAPIHTTGPSMDDRQRKVWESWKSRLGVTASKVVDALLTHGELNTQQLSIATGLHRTTVPNGIHALNKAGLINKNGGRFSLKQL